MCHARKTSGSKNFRKKVMRLNLFELFIRTKSQRFIKNGIQIYCFFFFFFQCGKNITHLLMKSSAIFLLMYISCSRVLQLNKVLPGVCVLGQAPFPKKIFPKVKCTNSNNRKNVEYNNEVITRKKCFKLSQHISVLKPCLA